MNTPAELRSAKWFAGKDLAGFLHRSALKAEGFSQRALTRGPIVGICNSWSELVNCNVHFRAIADAVRRGVLHAGGLPLEFSTMSLGENLMKPTTMLYRNLMAMEVEETLRAYPLDSVVLLGGCDKTVPAQLLGAASADIPAIAVTGGPSLPAVFRGRRLGVGTDLWRYTDDLRAGRMTAEEYDELETAASPSPGHCPEMGTASTMAAITEALGLALPGQAAIPAMNARRYAAAETAGHRAVALAVEDVRPSRILSSAAIDNAITLLIALAGSTNAVLHLLALAGRLGIDLPLERFDEIARRTPVLANIRPAGEYLFEDLYEAGGVPRLMAELQPLLSAIPITVAGDAQGPPPVHPTNGSSAKNVIGTLDDPIAPTEGLAILRGNLAPDGAVIKASAATRELLQHRGRALVFDGIADVQRRVDDPDLDVTPDSVLVLRNVGPKGGPGMPEWGQIPIPAKLLRAGVRDMVRISDARMSGTAYGTVVLHVAPEAAVGGPLGAVRDGDHIHLDLSKRMLELELEPNVVAARLSDADPPPRRFTRGYGAMFEDHVLQADQGCDFDFLRAVPGTRNEREPYGLLAGWIGGW